MSLEYILYSVHHSKNNIKLAWTMLLRPSHDVLSTKFSIHIFTAIWCRVIAYAEICIYGYGVYFMIDTFGMTLDLLLSIWSLFNRLFPHCVLGFGKILESMIIIALGTSFVMTILMLYSTLQEHVSVCLCVYVCAWFKRYSIQESTGIIFTYLMWGTFTTIFLSSYYVICYSDKKIITETVFAGLLVGTVGKWVRNWIYLVFQSTCILMTSTVLKSYAMLVVLSFMHMLVSSDSEDSSWDADFKYYY